MVIAAATRAGTTATNSTAGLRTAAAAKSLQQKAVPAAIDTMVIAAATTAGTTATNSTVKAAGLTTTAAAKSLQQKQ